MNDMQEITAANRSIEQKGYSVLPFMKPLLLRAVLSNDLDIENHKLVLIGITAIGEISHNPAEEEFFREQYHYFLQNRMG